VSSSIIRTFPRSSQEKAGDSPAPLVHSYKSQRHSIGTDNIEGFEVYKSSVKVLRRFKKSSQSVPDLRKNIYQFSEKSKRNLRFKILNSAYDFLSQFCLTYHENIPEDGRTCKKHLNTWLQYVRRNYPNIKYLWILEFQTSRRAPHFHVFLTTRPSRRLGNDLGEAWNRITADSESHKKWHQHPKNFITWEMKKGGYLTKYLDKANQKLVPEHFLSVGRFWGTSKGIVTDPEIYSRQVIGDAVKRGKEIFPDVLEDRTDYRTGEVFDPKNNFRFMYRCLRKYHEKTVKRVREKLGFKGRKYRSPITRVTSALLMDCAEQFRQIEMYLWRQYATYVPF
jgi:hypothetical protein